MVVMDYLVVMVAMEHLGLEEKTVKMDVMERMAKTAVMAKTVTV
jgi:hypothetical protein